MTVLSLTEINGQFGRENWPNWPFILYKNFILTIIWGDSDFGEWINVGDKKKDVGDMPIGHQHYYMLNCDVDDRFVMMEA